MLTTEQMNEEVRKSICKIITKMRRWQIVRLVYCILLAPAGIGVNLWLFLLRPVTKWSLLSTSCSTLMLIGGIILVAIIYFKDSRRLFELRLQLAMHGFFGHVREICQTLIQQHAEQQKENKVEPTAN